MIDSKELMIGNWVYEDSKINEEILQEATPVQTDVKLLYDLVTNNTGTYNYEPIPLTPEILSKIGGVKHVVVDIYKIPLSISNTLFIQLEFRAKDVVVGIKSEGGYITVNSFRNYSIHQLQNLYHSLTQQHLNIQL